MSGLLATEPLPARLIVKVYSIGVNVAVTVLLPSIVIVAGLVLPVRPPLHPLKV